MKDKLLDQILSHIKKGVKQARKQTKGSGVYIPRQTIYVEVADKQGNPLTGKTIKI